MRVSRRLAGSLIAAAALTAPVATPLRAQAPAAPAPATVRAATARAPRVVTLDNGLQVIVAESHAVPLATAKVVVRAGAMTQTPDLQGIPHLFEHMLFKGYRGGRGLSFGAEAGMMQAGFNGTTGEELVTYYLSGPSDHALDAVRLLAGLVREPRFEEDDLKTERFVVLGELQRGVSDPQDRLRTAVGRALWGEGWVRKNTIGEVTALLGVKTPELREVYGRWYVPNNAALVVTGDVDAERVVEAARRHFGGWRRRADPFAAAPVPAQPALDSSLAVVVSGPVETITVTVEWQGPSVGASREATDASLAADVLAAVVNDEGSSMTRNLVDRGYFQSAAFHYQTLAHTGPITFTGVTTKDRLAAGLTSLLAELDYMAAEDYFTAPALADAAKRRRVEAALEAEQGPALAHTLGYWWGVAGLDYHAGYDAGLAAQTPEGLRRFVRRYLAHRPFVAGALVPPGEEKATEVMLAQFLQFTAEVSR